MAHYRFNWAAYVKGLSQVASVEFLVLSVSFLGFGAFIRDSQLNVFHGMFLTGAIWALPGQVVLVNLLQEGAAWATIAVAVSLTAIRFLPMMVSMLPLVNNPGTPRWLLYLLSYFVSISVWVLANRHLHKVEKSQRLPWLMGVGSIFWAAMLGVIVIGYYLANFLPPLLSISLVFLTPTFFFISLFATARMAMDYLALGAGTVLGPILYFIIPQFDFLLAGVIGGTAAYFLGRARQRRNLPQ